jgi:hypothetical protein
MRQGLSHYVMSFKYNELSKSYKLGRAERCAEMKHVTRTEVQENRGFPHVPAGLLSLCRFGTYVLDLHTKTNATTSQR